jgi:superfamily II DNA or RNA helicase
MILYLNNYSASAYCDAWEYAALSSYLTVREGFDYVTGSPEVYEFYWITGQEWIHFEAGLAKEVLSYVQGMNKPVQVIDQRGVPDLRDMYPHAIRKFEARDYQHWASDQMIQLTRGVCDLATNSGKTYVIADYWWKMGKHPMLVLVPTVELLEQTASTLEEISGLQTGEIGRVGETQSNWKPVTVGITNSVYDWLLKYRQLPVAFTTLIVDEGHLQVATMARTVAQNTDATYRFWLSGTAFKDGSKAHTRRMVGLSGPLIAQISNDYLVQRGDSSIPIIRFVELRERPEITEELQGARSYRILKSHEARNELIADICREAKEANLVTLVFCEHKDHVRKLSSMMPWAEVVMGGQGTENKRIREQLEERMLSTVIATSAWRVGVSIPGIDHLLHAGAWKSTANILQEFGRVLRKKDYSDRCYFTDIYDYWNEVTSRNSHSRWATMTSQRFPVEKIKPCEVKGMFSRVPDWMKHCGQV